MAIYFFALDLTRGISWGFDLVLGSTFLASVLAMGLAVIMGWSDRPDQSDQSADSGATIS